MLCITEFYSSLLCEHHGTFKKCISCSSMHCSMKMVPTKTGKQQRNDHPRIVTSFRRANSCYSPTDPSTAGSTTWTP